ncbi:hypothetical protein Glove_144g109 [Diversispora epigaea]|uniref:Amino acid permease/ SLC12A domain-containing protein n=1 Tax=Diversispora epigaea TaxID=1348612 RepID=A0A397ITY8_9GLOM|nr:hypothetical protein Glove_144g109 [Diversispora epigaea]
MEDIVHYKLKLFSGICWNVNNMIGSGIFITPAIVWRAMGSPGAALLVWIGGGIIAMCGSLCFVELGLRFSRNGGEAEYLREAFPHPWNLASYLFSFTLIFSARAGTIGALSQAFAQYFWIATFSPFVTIDDRCDLNRELYNTWKDLAFWRLTLIALIALLTTTMINVYSSRIADCINKTLAIIKILTVLTIAIIGFTKIKNSTNWNDSFKRTDETDRNIKISDFTTALVAVSFSYSGYNNLNYSLNEFDDPNRNLIHNNTISVGIVGVLYVLANVAFISVVDYDSTNNSVIVLYFANGILTIAIIGFTKIKNSTNWNDSFKRTDETDRNIKISDFTTALVAVSFSYSGYNNLNYSLNEFDDPNRNLIHNNTISVGIVGVLYVLANVAFISVVDYDSTNNSVIVLYFANGILGSVFGKILSLFVALSAFGTLGSLIWSGSRVIATAGYRRYFPVFSDKLKEIGQRGTLKNALLFQCVLSAIVIVLVGAHPNSFQVLYSMAQYTSWLFYGIIGIGLISIRLRNRNFEFKVWWIAIFIFIACSLCITIVSFVETSDSKDDCSIPKVSNYLPNGISLGLLVIGFISWIFYWRKARSIEDEDQII